MTKKGIIFIIFISVILSIMLIAVWGTKPENTNLPPLDYIEFSDWDDLNDKGEKRKEISALVTESSPVYSLAYEYEPEVSYSDLVVSISKSDIIYQIDLDNKVILIYYNLDDIRKKTILTVTISDKRTNKSDTINLWFKFDDIIIIPD
jgi:hypothetical protein